METISKNTLVSISLKIEDQSGRLLDESDEVMYLHGGYGQIFQRVEDELEGKGQDARFDVLLSPEEAFGTFDETLMLKEPLEALPEDVEVGMELDGEDEGVVWVVEAIAEGFATLNANHQLAGIPLRVSGEVLELEQLSETGAHEILHMEHDHDH
jgi:FKBP-type peptidyl-prolyl cis-trans isomerase SlyD